MGEYLEDRVGYLREMAAILDDAATRGVLQETRIGRALVLGIEREVAQPMEKAFS